MKLSIQLYTVRDQLAQDPEGTLRALKEIGLSYVEGGGSYGTDSTESARKLLDEIGLKASGSHIGLPSLETDLDAAIADAKTLGVSYIIVPWVDSKAYSNDWKALGAHLAEIGKKVKEAGLTLAYHNHDFEFKNEGEPGLDQLFAGGDPEYLKSELDLAWVAIGGQDPVAYIKKLSNRLPLIHLKDYDPNTTPRWRPGGQGIIDWDACLAAANEAGVEFGAIELDESP
jgi:sugar phosphate isomerase/epimerase